MALDVFVVDAFTETQFKGNSAAVVPLSEWLTPVLMQKIAAENNLSETAFIKKIANNSYEIRWFSPITEIDFCGHATLASAFVLFNYLGCQGQIEFSTQKVGRLTVVQLDNGKIEMSFPIQLPQSLENFPEALLSGLSIQPLEVLKNRQAYIAVMASEDDVKNVTYKTEQLKLLAPFDVVVTAQASSYDFVSRYFWPANGGNEDPVTGSIHACLAPFWATRLSKQKLVAYQASHRGGILYCHVVNERVLISGHGVLYLRGNIYV